MAQTSQTNFPLPFGPFVLSRQLRYAPNGTVYAAKHRTSGRSVCLKVIPEEMRDCVVDQQFHGEFEVLQKIRHPNCPSYVAHGEHDGALYLATAYAEGTLLSRLVHKDNCLSVSRISNLTKQLAQAFDYFQQLGVVHRGLLPGNILLCRNGNPLILDFSMCQWQNDSRPNPVARQLMIPGAYLPPEILLNENSEYTFRGDVYQLGVLMYQLLTCRLPLGKYRDEILQNLQANIAVTSPRKYRGRLRIQLQQVCLAALQPDPLLRFHSARPMVAALRKYEQDRMIARAMKRRKQVAHLRAVSTLPNDASEFSGDSEAFATQLFRT